jgi:NitT/TauT family transport system substrate-binding protein
MTSRPDPHAPNTIDSGRRKLLRAAGTVALATPVLMRPLPQLSICGGASLAALAPSGAAWGAGPSAPAKPLKKITFAWNAAAFCLTSTVVAQDQGFFQQNGLDANLINYSGSTDQLLESLATGKADAAIGMIHRWLKPLEAGFDVKIIGSTHGGCVRLVGSTRAGVTTLQSLKGKTIGVSDLASPGKQFFAILLIKNGIDPDKDVQWRQYPADLLGTAVDKGEAQAIADGDPLLYLLQKREPGKYTNLASNLSGDYKSKVCCIVGARGSLVRDDRPTAAAIARSILQATEFTHHNPSEAAKSFLKFAPKGVTADDLNKLYATLTYDHHPIGADLQQEIAYYAEDFRRIGVLKKSTDPNKFAQTVYVNVLS